MGNNFHNDFFEKIFVKIFVVCEGLNRAPFQSINQWKYPGVNGDYEYELLDKMVYTTHRGEVISYCPSDNLCTIMSVNLATPGMGR